jgi:hypothetical protein
MCLHYGQALIIYGIKNYDKAIFLITVKNNNSFQFLWQIAEAKN